MKPCPHNCHERDSQRSQRNSSTSLYEQFFSQILYSYVRSRFLHSPAWYPFLSHWRMLILMRLSSLLLTQISNGCLDYSPDAWVLGCQRLPQSWRLDCLNSWASPHLEMRLAKCRPFEQHIYLRQCSTFITKNICSCVKMETMCKTLCLYP